MVGRSAHRGRGRALAAALALTLGATALVSGAAAPAGAAPAPRAAAPTPTPARVGKPTTMAALGDSITQATGTGEISQENPKNSWATGWEVDSVRARLGISTANAQNLSANGARMGNADTQVLTGRDGQALRTTTQYVVLEMGGNDLCRDSVAEMTPTSTYRTQLREALTAIRSRAPEALVFVMSVPDIYNLWYIRGAPQNATYHPEPQSDQASGLNGARFYWSQSFFPCRSLLSNPDSYAQADRDRRAAVRQRTKDYNAALRAECGQWLRCRYDGDRLFNLTSNRVSPPDGPLKPRAQWDFTDADISRNEGAGRYLCPVQGLLAGGCGDHFHPSKAGQVKLADSATAASYQWSDVTPPTATATQSPAPAGDGTTRGPVTVSFGGTDAAGLRGQEVRIHSPNGSVSAWSPSVGVHAPVSVTAVGTSYVEVRSLDNNGNTSRSTILPVTVRLVAPGAPSAPTFAREGGADIVRWDPPTDDGGAPVASYDLEVVDHEGTTTGVQVTAPSAALPVRIGRAVRARVRANGPGGTGAWSAVSGWAVPPFATTAGFADGVAPGLLGRALTADERAAAVGAIEGGTLPAAVAAGWVDSAEWSGTLSPLVRLYRAYFLRLPDSTGLAYWEQRHRQGMTVRAISDYFSGSREFRDRYGSLANREFVRRVYLNVLEREPEQSGWDFWTAELDSGRYSRGRLMAYYSESAEYRARASHQILPSVLWWGVLGRVPTTAEQQQAATDLGAGRTVADLADDLLATEEWAAHVTS